jgi:hypothetical protein
MVPENRFQCPEVADLPGRLLFGFRRKADIRKRLPIAIYEQTPWTGTVHAGPAYATPSPYALGHS